MANTAQKTTFSDMLSNLSVDDEGFLHVTQEELSALLDRTYRTGFRTGALNILNAMDDVMERSNADSDEKDETESPSGNASSQVMAGDSAAHRKTQMITRTRRLKDFPHGERLSGRAPPTFDAAGNVVEFPNADRLRKGL